MKRITATLLSSLTLLGAVAVAQTSGPDATPIVGGGSFNTAPRLEPGTYADTVLPAETTYYRVRLDEGQRLNANVEVDLSGLATDPKDPAFDIRLLSLLYQFRAFTPLRQEVPQAGVAQLDGSGDTRSGSITTPRALPLRLALKAGPEFTGPGDWYLAINVGETTGEVRQSVELPIELTVEVTP